VSTPARSVAGLETAANNQSSAVSPAIPPSSRPPLRSGRHDGYRCRTCPSGT